MSDLEKEWWEKQQKYLASLTVEGRYWYLNRVAAPEEFDVDGVVVVIIATENYGSWESSRVKDLARTVEDLLGRRLLGEREVLDIVDRYYFGELYWEALRFLNKADTYAFDNGFTRYITARQLVRLLPPRVRYICESCGKRFHPKYGEHFYTCGVGGVEYVSVCSWDCQEQMQERRKTEWQKIKSAREKLREVRRWLRDRRDP